MVRLDEGSTMIFALAEAIRPLPNFFDYLNDDLLRMVSIFFIVVFPIAAEAVRARAGAVLCMWAEKVE